VPGTAELLLLVALVRCPTSTHAEAAVAWRDAASRWEERASICLVHLRAAQHDQLLGELAKQPAVAEVRRPWGWWAGGVAAGAGAAAGAATLLACESSGCRGAGAAVALALGLAAVVATVAF
jgi:hypothetical protein